MQALPPPRASPGVTLCLSLSVSVTVATRRGASLCVPLPGRVGARELNVRGPGNERRVCAGGRTVYAYCT